ncbi:hypothetical protein NM920_003757, partial [Vibrio cholerae]|nr:hypothetical protein [Vibrio cholerae]
TTETNLNKLIKSNSSIDESPTIIIELKNVDKRSSLKKYTTDEKITASTTIVEMSFKMICLFNPPTLDFDVTYVVTITLKTGEITNKNNEESCHSASQKDTYSHPYKVDISYLR